MQLTDGICSLLSIQNTAAAGEQPVRGRVQYAEAWYGRLDYAADNEPETDVQGTEIVTQRIRILDDARVRLGHYVRIDDVDYKVTRIFRGADDDSGERIIDITMEAASYGNLI